MSQQIKYILNPRLIELFNDFTELSGKPLAFHTFDSFDRGDQVGPDIIGATKPPCKYCHLLQYDLGLLPKCLQSDIDHIDQCRKQSRIVHYTCHAGLEEIVAPVFFGSNPIGFVMTGQFRIKSDVPNHIIEFCKNKNIDSEKIKRAYHKIPLIRPRKLHAMINILTIITKYIAYSKYVMPTEADAVTYLIQYMQENISEHLSLEKASKMTFYSKSTISHVFKRHVNKSFLKYQIELKLDEAQRILKTTPGITVSQVAFSLGFQDPLYFSRLYKKHKNKAPSLEIPPPKKL